LFSIAKTYKASHDILGRTLRVFGDTIGVNVRIILTMPPQKRKATIEAEKTGYFAFKEILPRLVSTFEAGRLVPFIGPGMSKPLCAGSV
jgi:hypothetical protein